MSSRAEFRGVAIYSRLLTGIVLPNGMVAPTGHEASAAPPEHNLALGERRAATVSDALIAHGIDAFRISIRSFGERQPLCT